MCIWWLTILLMSEIPNNTIREPKWNKVSNVFIFVKPFVRQRIFVFAEMVSTGFCTCLVVYCGKQFAGMAGD